MRRDLLLSVLRDDGGLGRGHGQGINEFLTRDHPPLQLDLGGLQRRSRQRRGLPKLFGPHTSSRLALLQQTQNRRHRAHLDD
ncbi:hypothetical protein [Streptomyces sp. NBC_00045]|uniref:hypothetical protein n=1 Tax=Streptomyces sp. NBC_00045 TaxID=2975625 RepID=UPI003869D9E1